MSHPKLLSKKNKKIIIIIQIIKRHIFKLTNTIRVYKIQIVNQKFVK